MKIFRTEMMNGASYSEYMSGGYHYTVMYYDVEAETKEEAITIAKRDNPDYHINTYAEEVEKKGIYHHRKGQSDCSHRRAGRNPCGIQKRFRKT